MSRAQSSTALVLGASPRVHLLPPEVQADEKARGVRRLLVTVLVGVVAIVVLGTGAASVSLVSSSVQLENAQSHSRALIAEQGKYSPVLTLQNQLADITTVQPIAATGEILWQPYIASIQASLPPDTTITSLDAQLQADSGAAASSTDAVKENHIATVTITADSPKASISDWLDNLAKLKGFVDATPGTVTNVEGTTRYKVSVALRVNDGALANRFVEEKKK